MPSTASVPPRPASVPRSWLDAPGTRPQAPSPDAAAEAIGAGFTRDPDPAWGPCGAGPGSRPAGRRM